MTIAGVLAQAVSSGTATCTVADLTAGGIGPQRFTPVIPIMLPRRAPGLTQTVNKKTTTTTVSSSLDPSTVGEAVTYTATLSAAAATGTVEFKQAGVTIVGALRRRSAREPRSVLWPISPSGWRQWVTAVYSGDGNDYGCSTFSWIDSDSQQENHHDDGVVFVGSLDRRSSCDLHGDGEHRGGDRTVEFKQAGVTITGCAAQPVSSGTATCTVTILTAGWHGHHGNLLRRQQLCCLVLPCFDSDGQQENHHDSSIIFFESFDRRASRDFHGYGEHRGGDGDSRIQTGRRDNLRLCCAGRQARAPRHVPWPISLRW